MAGLITGPPLSSLPSPTGLPPNRPAICLVSFAGTRRKINPPPRRFSASLRAALLIYTPPSTFTMASALKAPLFNEYICPFTSW